MATDKLINHSQGESIIADLDAIATNLQNVTAISPAKFGMGYAVCNTAAGTAAKEANLANYTLTEGALVTVKFTYANTASNATLNLNSTGAKPIYYKGSAITGDIISAGDIATFVYSTNAYNIINLDALSGAGAGTVRAIGAENGLITDQSDNADISISGKIGLDLKSDTAYTGTVADPSSAVSVSDGRVYPVALDGDGHPVVGVPWTDTTYTQASNSAITVNNSDHTIDVAVGAVGTKGVVELSTEIPATGAVDTKVATEKAVADSISGKAIGANSSTTNAIATFAGTDGKTLADSAVTIAQNATGVTDDDTKVPTSKAVKTYVDATATGISRYIGTITAVNQLSTTAKKGDFYIVSTAWTGVHAGDEIIAETNNPAQTIDGTNWTLLHNEADTNTTYAFAEGTTNGKFTVTPSDTGTAQSVTVHGLKSAAYTESTDYATSSHVHGDITNDGKITSDTTAGSGDKLVITDSSASHKVVRSGIALSSTVLSQTQSTRFLREDGSWTAPSYTTNTDTHVNTQLATTSKAYLLGTTTTPTGTASAVTTVADTGVYLDNTAGKLHATTLDATTYTGLPTAGTSASGIVSLTDSVNTTSSTVAATATAVKTVNTLATTNQTNILSMWDTGFAQKNLSQWNSGTSTSAKPTMAEKIPFTSDGGEYVISYETALTGGTISVGFKDSSGNVTLTTELGNTNPVKTVTIPANTAYFNLYTLAYGDYYNFMICTKSQFDISSTYQPYALPNTAITPELIELCDSGAKNLFAVAGETRTVNTVTATYNSDGSITTSGTATGGNANFTILTLTAAQAQALNGKVLSGCPSGGSEDTYSLILQRNSSPWSVYARDIGNSTVIKGVEAVECVLILQIKEGKSKAATWYPMICSQADYTVSKKYVPHRVPITGIVAVNRSIACSTTETSTGIKFVSSKTAMYKITVTAHYGASKPLSLKIKQKVNASASAYPFVVVESTDNSIALTATGIMTLGVNGEFEIFATYSSASNNNIYMLVEELG